MFDMNLYNQIYSAAEAFLRKNINIVGQQFAQGFLQNYNPNMNAQLAGALYEYVVRTINGRSFTADDLFVVVGRYIEQVFSKQQQQTAFPSAGGFGGSMQFGQFSSPMQNMYGGNSATPSMVGAGSHFSDPTPAPQPTMRASAPAAVAAPAPITNENVLIKTSNPVDTLKTSDGFAVGRDHIEASNWGEYNPNADTIAFIDRRRGRTSDNRVEIVMCNAFEKQYMSDPVDVLKDFLRSAPSRFLAENFIFRIFYNHVETVNVSTESFIEVRDHFTAVKRKYPSAPTYRTIIDILDTLKHGTRQALASYLVKHINRGLFIACGMTQQPDLRIKFTDIEDLEQLLGPEFQHQILTVPGSRTTIARIVDNAIINALTQYSEVMFQDIDEYDADIIRTSPAFPYSIDGVYPNKMTIPGPKDSHFEDFKLRMKTNCLKTKTFVRSIRSVVVTNSITTEILSRVGDDPIRMSGPIPGIFREYLLPYTANTMSYESKCEEYNPNIPAPTVNESYESYLNDSDAFTRHDLNFYMGLSIPDFPVDQTVFAFQYKRDPREFMMALDIASTMDEPEPTTHVEFVKRYIPQIKIG